MTASSSLSFQVLWWTQSIPSLDQLVATLWSPLKEAALRKAWRARLVTTALLYSREYCPAPQRRATLRGTQQELCLLQSHTKGHLPLGVPSSSRSTMQSSSRVFPRPAARKMAAPRCWCKAPTSCCRGIWLVCLATRRPRQCNGSARRLWYVRLPSIALRPRRFGSATMATTILRQQGDRLLTPSLLGLELRALIHLAGRMLVAHWLSSLVRASRKLPHGIACLVPASRWRLIRTQRRWNAWLQQRHSRALYPLQSFPEGPRHSLRTLMLKAA